MEFYKSLKNILSLNTNSPGSDVYPNRMYRSSWPNGYFVVKGFKEGIRELELKIVDHTTELHFARPYTPSGEDVVADDWVLIVDNKTVEVN